jgi:glutathione peroxidase
VNLPSPEKGSILGGMKTILCLFLMSFFAEAAVNNFYELKAPRIDGKPEALSDYKGKVTLVVNTASHCGFTPQYEGLESLYGKYKNKGFVILGFPSNDFHGQEPGSNEEIKKFCEMKYKVTFPMFSKDTVLGEKKQPVYQFLTQKASPTGEVEWNFEKFLIDKHGNVVGRYRSKTTPLSEELTSAIEKELAKK